MFDFIVFDKQLLGLLLLETYNRTERSVTGLRNAQTRSRAPALIRLSIVQDRSGYRVAVYEFVAGTIPIRIRARIIATIRQGFVATQCTDPVVFDFTIGLTNAIREAAQKGQTRTIVELRDSAAEYIRGHVDEWAIHNPQVFGSEQLASGAMEILPLADGNGPNRKKLLDMVAKQDRPFDMGANKEIFSLGDPVELSMTIPFDGYLNVITVDSQDNATVLFPNAYHADHAVKAGEFRIPTEQMEFQLPASEPIGSTLIVAFVTADPVNFYTSTLDDRNTDGSIDVALASMSHVATRAIQVAPRKKEMYATRIEVDVRR